MPKQKRLREYFAATGPARRCVPPLPDCVTQTPPEGIVPRFHGQLFHAATGYPVSGLLEPMRQRFYPTYQRPTPTRKSQFGYRPEMGKRVEEELAEWFATGKRCRLKQARQIAEWIDRHEYEFVAAQHPLYHHESRIGTFIDLLLRDPASGELLLIEIKTGYGYGSHVAGAGGSRSIHLEPPLDHIMSTAHTHAMMQLAWMHHVLAETYGIATRPLLVVSNTRLRIHKLPKRIKALASCIIHHIAKTP